MDPHFATAKSLFSAGGAWNAATGGGSDPALYVNFLKQHSVTTLALFADAAVASYGAAHAIAAAAKKAGINVVYEDDATPFTSFDPQAWRFG